MSLGNDLRTAWRALRRAPASSLLVTGMLAAGIGAATAIFSLVNVLVLRPVAGVSDDGRLVSVERSGGVGVIDIFSYPDYLDIRDRVSPAANVAAFRRAGFDVRAARAEHVRGALVSGNYFDVLGIRAQLGRTLTPADEHADVMVIGHACWRDLFGSSPDVVGHTMAVNGHAFTVIGVLGPEFTGTYPGQLDTVWLPIRAQPVVLPRMSANVLANRNSRWLQIMGRMSPGASRAAVAAQVLAAGRAIALAFPGDHAAGDVTIRDGLGLASDDRAQIMRLLGVLGGAAALLLLIACGNAANLLLARAQDRRREAEIRRALGAGALRLARTLLIEAAWLAGLATAIGLWLAPQIARWLVAVAGSGYGIGPGTSMVDWRAAAFAASTAIAITIVFTLLPLRGILSARAYDALRSGGRTSSSRRTGARSALVMLQVAFSVVLGIGAGLGLRTMREIQAVRPGYATSGIVTADYALDVHGYTPGRAADFFRALASGLRSQPGVEAVSWSTVVPPELYGGRRSVFRRGEAPPQEELQRFEQRLGVRADSVVAGPEFFKTMGIALHSGREFSDRDRDGVAPVAIVNRALAERLWPGEEPIGQFLEAPPYSGAVPPPFQVIGVAEDTRQESLLSDRRVPVLYLPFLQNPDTRATLLIRTNETATIAAALRRTGARIDADVPPLAIQDISDHDAATLWEQRSVAAAFGLFAVFGLALAAVGVYAALAHDVASRRRELAMRVALGASVGGIAGLVVRDAVRQAGAGTLIGLGLALAGSGRLQGVLFGVSPRDPVTFVCASLILLLLTFAASTVPARRAAGADPSEVLRLE